MMPTTTPYTSLYLSGIKSSRLASAGAPAWKGSVRRELKGRGEGGRQLSEGGEDDDEARARAVAGRDVGFGRCARAFTRKTTATGLVVDWWCCGCCKWAWWA